MSRYIQDVELTYILLCRERSCNCFIYVYICVYIYQNTCFKLISFLRSFDMNTNNFYSEPFTFLKHFFFYSAISMRTKTWNELCLRNKEPWSQYIAYNSTSQSLFDHQKYLKEAFELSKRDKYNLQLLKMWPCPINLLTFMFLEKTNVHPFFQRRLITQLDVKLLTRFFVQMCFQSNEAYWSLFIRNIPFFFYKYLTENFIRAVH